MYTLESVSHLQNLPFKFIVTNIDSCGFHWHYDYEIALVLKGKVNIRIENKDSFLEQGDLIVLNSQQVHSLISLKDNICFFIQFSPEVFYKIGSSKRQYLFHINSATSPRKEKYLPILENIINIYEFLQDKQLGYELHLEGEFYKLVANLIDTKDYSISQNSPKLTYENDFEILNKLNDFIEKNYKDQLTVDAICKELAMSPSVLYGFLKNVVGITLGDFIRYYRIREAKRLLLNSNNSISQIAHLCGYQNENTFYRAFKNELRITPNEYRNVGDASVNIAPIQGYLTYSANEVNLILREFKKLFKNKNTNLGGFLDSNLPNQ